MDPLRIICEQQGLFTRAQAREAGYDDRAVQREMRSRRWHRIRRGYYTFPDLWSALTPEARHLVRCHAVVDSLGGAVALSHTSGTLRHGIAVWGVSLDRVHVTRLDGGAGRIEGDVVHHEGFVGVNEVEIVCGLPVLPAARCVLETSSLATSESALVSLNSALQLERCTFEELADRFKTMEHWPRMRHVHVPLRMATGKAQSVGESRGLWFFWAHRLPAPELQHEVRDLDGTLVGITDWAWPRHRQLGEFDGKVKYGRLLQEGQEPGDAVFNEKVREDRLRELTGFGMIRLVWSDYDREAATLQRLRRFLTKAG